MLDDKTLNPQDIAGVIVGFFGSLDNSAAGEVGGLVGKIMETRGRLGGRVFAGVMHAVFGTVGIRWLCEGYPIRVDGNIADEGFEDSNNLWLLQCT
jgi:hypothetical protein